jgi:hypothetical protein
MKILLPLPPSSWYYRNVPHAYPFPATLFLRAIQAIIRLNSASHSGANRQSQKIKIKPEVLGSRFPINCFFFSLVVGY